MPFEAHRSLPKNRPRKENILVGARFRGASRFVEACPKNNKPPKENVLAAARSQGTSRLVKLAQEQASEGKRIGRSMISRRLEAHRGLPKKRPRKENVLARARSRSASRLIEACPRRGLGRQTYWHEHHLEALRGSSKLDQEQASEGKRIGTSTISNASRLIEA